MDIDIPLRELGAIDTTALSEAILALDDVAWRENEYRQKSYYVHNLTRSIILVSVDDEKWPDRDVRKGPGWERLADVALPVMEEIIKQHYSVGGEVIRAMAAGLQAGGTIKAHTDLHESFHVAHRIHVPITTNPRVWFSIDGRPYQLKVGQAYEINNQKQHSVANKGSEARITFIFDYIPPETLANLPGKVDRSPESRDDAR